MGFEPTHAVTRLPRFQHGLLSLLSNLPLFTNLVYHKAFFLANLFEVEEPVIEIERKRQKMLDFDFFYDRINHVIVHRR